MSRLGRMRVRWMIVAAVLLSPILLLSRAQEPSNESRAVPVVVRALPQRPICNKIDAILVDVEIFNGLKKDIGFRTYSMKPNEWNGETYGVELKDISRVPDRTPIFVRRPEVDFTERSTNAGRETIAPGKKAVLTINLKKWEVKGGWTPGRYQFSVVVFTLDADSYTTLRVSSPKAEFEIE